MKTTVVTSNTTVINNYTVNQKWIEKPTFVVKYVKKEELVKECETFYDNLHKVYPNETIASMSEMTDPNMGKGSLISYYRYLFEKLVNLSAREEGDEQPIKKSKKEHVASKRGDANERLEKYTKELEEKEAIENPSKEIKHRIASLKRKIARAEAALETSNSK